MRLALAGAVVAVLLGVIAFAAFAFWLAVTLLPVVILAGLIAYGALRFQLWRDRR
jgi:high-affinity Fe2+/Pb2+ permease